MKGIKNFFKSPLFCFHGICGKVCPTDSHFFGLSRSTRCGCCSYQVSSISVWRVTRYDHFAFFILFAFWSFPWQRQPFWKNQPLKEQLHMAFGIPTRFHKVWSRHLREMCRRNFWQKKERIITIRTRYDYNLTIMKSPKPATDTIYPPIKFWWYRTMLNFYPPIFMSCFGSHFENGRHFENAELLL
jgi:hypothetical protein